VKNRPCLTILLSRFALLAAMTIPFVPAVSARAETLNGNDFALYYSEAKTPREKKEVLDRSLGKPHFFRYLQIMEMERNKEGTAIAITAFEPSSLMDVRFTVTKSESLVKLAEDPMSKIGDAIAITGVVRGIATNTISCSPVIVRHKDRLHPKRGKELLCEVDPTATFYSYTGGDRPVSLTYKDRDLLQYRDQMLAQKGKRGWAEFLEQEMAKRKKDREAARKKAAAAAAAGSPAQ
jgi:hypothetical protein